MHASNPHESPELPTMNGTSAMGSKPAARRPTLLPAFEPFSSSPPARPAKAARLNYSDDTSSAHGRSYPTPIPTSSTGILPSSPNARPGLVRTMSSVSERSPLVDVPTAAVPEDGTPLLIGRSSSSCHFQVPRNGFVSRVHVSVTYADPTPAHASGQVVVKCLGWNGCSVHCRGRVQALSRGDSFVSADPAVDIMIDVLDTRVILVWPEGVHREASAEPASDDGDDGWLESPTRRGRGNREARFAPPPSSPPAGPVSPPLSPRRRLHTARGTGAGFQVYEDRESSAEASKENIDPNPEPRAPSSSGSLSSLSSRAVSPSPEDDEGSAGENEENEPMVHAMGPFGTNMLSQLDAFSTESPQQPASAGAKTNPRKRARRNSTPPPPLPRHPLASPIRNHVVNQLAFSRVHSVPLSSIMGNLPADLRAAPLASLAAMAQQQESTSIAAPAFGELTNDAKMDDGQEEKAHGGEEGVRQLTAAELRQILRETPCVGEIARSGKDAAGKQLENEFYYVPERDDSAMRREAVVAGAGRTSLRAVRRNHKVSSAPGCASEADGCKSNTSGRSRASEHSSRIAFSVERLQHAFSAAFFLLLLGPFAHLLFFGNTLHPKSVSLTHQPKTTPLPRFILLARTSTYLIPRPTEKRLSSIGSSFYRGIPHLLLRRLSFAGNMPEAACFVFFPFRVFVQATLSCRVEPRGSIAAGNRWKIGWCCRTVYG